MTVEELFVCSLPKRDITAEHYILITLVGITQFTRKEHIARATIEATCFQTKAILDAMEKDSGTTLHALAVDGGMSNSDVCMQVCYLPLPFY